MDRLTAYRAFVRTVDLGSQAAAAAELGVSQTMLGRYIRDLEDQLGTRLLNRTTRRQSLTEAGHAFHARVSSALEDLTAAERSVLDLQTEPRGRLRVNAPTTFGVLYLAGQVAAYCERYPQVKVELVLNDRFVDLVEEGYDLAIRIGRLDRSSLIARRLASARAVVCASPAYLARRGTPLCPADLRGHDCQGYTYASQGDEWTFEGPDGVEAVRVSGTLETNSGTAAVAAAIAGLGIILKPTFMVADALRSGALVRLLPDHAPPTVGIHAVYPHARNLSPKVRAFVDLLAAAFRDAPWDRGLFERESTIG
jgi:DNA-binding transcriptional LysR family regulator